MSPPTANLVFKVFANLYKDSVSLMQIGARLRLMEGVEQASCVMATPANLAQLHDAGLAIEATVAPSDLLVVVRGEPAACEAAIAAAAAALQAAGAAGDGGGAGATAFSMPLTSLALGVQHEAGANLALISVPGDYAAAEAMKALALGLHVMLFSDNVSLADERTIKIAARDKGLLVMGPDCGTAIVNGIPLGFANVVRRGDIGLVAASGTGLQEVTCRIHNLGAGISQALGTGGRDLKEEIGGITMLQGLAALAEDEATRIIVLVSKPPAPAIAQQILGAAAATGKPTVVHFLGAKAEQMRQGALQAAASLRHAGDLAVALSMGLAPPAWPGAEVGAAGGAGARASSVPAWLAGMAPGQHAVRALFTGGTFCYEAQLAFIARGLACSSNAEAKGAQHFDGRWQGHVLLDLGDDDYTRGRPHPMIDPTLRNELVRAQGADAAVAAILFDVVLGYGAHADPAHELAESLAAAKAMALAQGRTLALIGHVCGTDGDPQGKAEQVAVLQAAGACIASSNIEAAELAADLAVRLARHQH